MGPNHRVSILRSILLDGLKFDSFKLSATDRARLAALRIALKSGSATIPEARLYGTLIAQNALIGDLQVLVSLAGNALGVNTIVGDLSIDTTVTVSGTLDNINALIGDMYVDYTAYLAGNLHGINELVADLSVDATVYLAGIMAQTNALIGDAQLTYLLEGTLIDANTLIGNAMVTTILAGNPQNTNALVGDLQVAYILAGILQDTSTLIGDLTVSPPTMLTYRYVGFTGQFPNETWTTNATKNYQLYRLFDVIMSPCDQIAVWWDNAAFTGSEDNGPTHIIDKVSVEINGVAVAVEFSGVRNKTLSAGNQLVYSDLLDASDFGLTFFTPGMGVWIKGVGHTTGTVTDLTRDIGVMNGPSGGAVISGAISGYYQSPGDNTDLNQVDTAGAWDIGSITTGGGAVATNVHFPSGIVGRTTADAEPLIALVDSLGDGYIGKIFDGTTNTGGALEQAAWNAGKAFFRLGRYGTAPTNMSTKTTTMVEAQYSSSRLFYGGIQQNFTNLFDGINTLASIQAVAAAMWSLLADASHGGARPVYAMEMVIPNQTSTAGATTYATQTKYAGGPAYFEAYNTWLAGKGPAGDNTVQGILPWAPMYSAANANKITELNRAWTLGTTVSSGASTIRLNGSLTPIEGEGLWIGGAGAEAVMINEVTVVTPGSVWDVTLYATSNTNLNIGGATANGHTAGAAINASYQPFDLAHFTHNGHKAIAAALVGVGPF